MPFELTIVTPEGMAFQGTAERVVLPGSEGDFGVLASHERLGALELYGDEGARGLAESRGEDVQA